MSTDSKKPSLPSRTTFPADKYVLTDIHGVPALDDVSPDQALSFFNQMLENLMLLHRTIILDPTTSATHRRLSDERAMSSSSVGSPGSNNSSHSNLHDRRMSSPSSISSVDSSAAISSDSPKNSTDTFPGIVSPFVMSHQATLRRFSSSGATPEGGHLLNSPSARPADTEAILEEAAAVASAVVRAQENGLENSSSTRIVHTDEPSSEADHYNTPPTLIIRDKQRKAVSKQEVANKSVIIKRFWGKKPPDITVWDYLLRMHHYCPMSPAVYLAAGLYVYRLCVQMQTFVLTPLSVHRLVLAALRIACKNIEDINFKQTRFASVCGITNADLYRLEVAFLFLIDFDICIDAIVLQHQLVILTELNSQTSKYRKLLKGAIETSDVAVL